MRDLDSIALGAERQYENELLLRFAFLPEYLLSTGSGADLFADRLKLLSELIHFPGATVMQRATPFLWRQLRKCYFHASRGDSELYTSCQNLLVMTFDSFFCDITTGSAADLRFDQPTSVVLPSLGILTPPLLGKVQMQRTADYQMTIETEDWSRSIDITHIEKDLKFPWLEVDSNARLFLTFHPMLMSADLESVVGRLSSEQACAIQIRDSIRDALSIVDLVDPSFSARLRKLIRFYVALRDPEQPFTHNSFTASSLTGIIFVSAAYATDALTEAIIHEFHHNELNTISQIYDVWIETEPTQFFYSPWRSDPRPLRGLFHAVYVFFGVIEYYRQAERVPELFEKRVHFRKRRKELCYQLRTALAQLRGERLTNTGRKIVAYIRAGLNRHMEEIGPLRTVLPEPQEQHLARWCQENPALSASVNVTW